MEAFEAKFAGKDADIKVPEILKFVPGCFNCVPRARVYNRLVAIFEPGLGLAPVQRDYMAVLDDGGVRGQVRGQGCRHQGSGLFGSASLLPAGTFPLQS